MSELLYKCPTCSKALSIDRAGSGRMCKCTDCQSVIRIPEVGLEFKCFKCNHDLCAPTQLAGVTFSCPNCESEVSVPFIHIGPSINSERSSKNSVKVASKSDNSTGTKFRCPSCRRKLEVPADMAGQMITCPDCKNQIMTHSLSTQLPSSQAKVSLATDRPRKSNQKASPLMWIVIFALTALVVFWVQRLYRDLECQREHQNAQLPNGQVIKTNDEMIKELNTSIRNDQRKQSETEQIQQQEMEKQKQAQTALEEKQRAAQTCAETEFQKISFTPTIHLCNSLQARGVTAQVTGVHLQDIQNAYLERNWMKMLRFIMKENEFPQKEGFPAEEQIQNAIKAFAKKDFSLVLKPQFSLPADKKLICIFLDEDSFLILSDWVPPPDGVGLCHSWQPEHKEIFIFLCNSIAASTDLVSCIHGIYEKELTQLKEMKFLKKISENEYQMKTGSVWNKQRDTLIDLMSEY